MTTVATDGATSQYSKLAFWRFRGPAWIGGPPYKPTGVGPCPATPSSACTINTGSDAHSPTWSPDSGAMALANDSGLWIVQVCPLSRRGSCAHFRRIVRGGSAPDWGPARFRLSQRPRR